jgi:hypothetical protein
MSNHGDQYDIFVGKNVVLTCWNDENSFVKVIKNNKKNKYLEVTSPIAIRKEIHYLTYQNIGEGCVVTDINVMDEEKP